MSRGAAAVWQTFNSWEVVVMLGKKLGEESGKVIGTRILPGEGGRMVKMEITFRAEGTLLGKKGTNMGTYVVYERIPGQLYGEGQGIFITEEGGAIWSGFGVGEMTGEGMGVKWAAAVTYQTNVKSLAALNTIVGVVEHETDDEGNASDTAWEWKPGK
jgi:hypothetical protein